MWKKRSKNGLLCAGLMVSVLGVGWSQNQPVLPEGKEKALVETICSQCHGLSIIASRRLSDQDWEVVVTDMVSQGAPLTDAEAETVAQYLAQHFGLEKDTESSSPIRASEDSKASSMEKDKINVNKATAKQLETSLGLSEKEAEAVVSYRQKNGNFAKWEDLEKVGGLNSKKIQAKKDQLVF